MVMGVVAVSGRKLGRLRPVWPADSADAPLAPALAALAALALALELEPALELALAA